MAQINRSFPSSDYLELDQVRQELLSTMSYNISSPYSCSDPFYILDQKPAHMESRVQSASTPPPVGRVLRSPFTGNVFSDSTVSTAPSWPTLEEAATSLTTRGNDHMESSYVPVPSLSSIYQQSSFYGTFAPSMTLVGPSPVFSHTMASMLSTNQNTTTTPQTVAPNALQRGSPVHYSHIRPAQTAAPQPTSHPYTPQRPYTVHTGPSVNSTSSPVSVMPYAVHTGASTIIKDEPMVLTPSYDSEFLSSPSSATDEGNMTDTSDQMQAHLLLRAPSASDSEAKDAFLVHAKRLGLSYREIKQRGGFKEAESTLRGRYRTITKAKQERVRKPVWKSEDIALLREGVARYAEITTKIRAHRPTPLSAGAGAAGTATASPNTPSDTTHTTYQEVKVPWKKVSAYIAENGGSYRFGNATCKKKWFEISGEQSHSPVRDVSVL